MKGNAVEFIETAVFSKLASVYLNDQEFRRLQMVLVLYPAMGALIPSSGGLRKLRWVSGSKGKRGGLRVIYYWVSADNKIYLLYLYSKNKQENLSKEQLMQLRSLMEE